MSRGKGEGKRWKGERERGGERKKRTEVLVMGKLDEELKRRRQQDKETMKKVGQTWRAGIDNL